MNENAQLEALRAENESLRSQLHELETDMGLRIYNAVQNERARLADLHYEENKKLEQKLLDMEMRIEEVNLRALDNRIKSRGRFGGWL